ncbi:MAG TPA: aminoglycoside phosphotransferase family protein [Microlunatus sp.]|nr:aminoglycoside phosphotransferase family protein [Microlunatus sp.]
MARYVAEHFGWAEPSAMTYVADGAMGRVWRLTAGGESYAVKELYWARDAPAEDAAVARQVRFCEVARAAGVAAPANLMTSSGGYVIGLPPALGGRLVRAYEWVQGRPITSFDVGGAVWAGGGVWAGRTEAVIEGLAVPADDQAVDPWFCRAPSPDAWEKLARRCAEQNQPWADRLQRTIPEFVALADLVGAPDAAELIVTHTDFQPQNVLVDGDGRFVLLDWDDSGPSTRRRALGRLLNDWHLRGATVDRAGIRRTMRSYRAAGGTAYVTEVADFGDSICGYLNYVYGQAELSLDQSQPDDLRVDAGRRLPDLLDPLPPSTYEAAITAAS